MKLVPLRSQDVDFAAGLYRQTQDFAPMSIPNVLHEEAQRRVGGGEGFFYVLLDDAGQGVGMGGFENINWIDSVAEPVIAIAAPRRKKGLGRLLAQALFDVAKKKLNLRRLQTYLCEGAHSAALLHDLGFEQEGRLKQARFKDGEFKDVVVYGLVLQ